jgi:hypothetical protein
MLQTSRRACVARVCASRGFVRNLSDAKKDEKAAPPPPGVPYSKFVLGVPKESFEGEKRIATTPSVVSKFVKQGLRVVVEKGAGEGSSISDAQYVAAGAKIETRDAAFAQDMVFKVICPCCLKCSYKFGFESIAYFISSLSLSLSLSES